jgi:hypothetical protein
MTSGRVRPSGVRVEQDAVRAAEIARRPGISAQYSSGKPKDGRLLVTGQ